MLERYLPQEFAPQEKRLLKLIGAPIKLPRVTEAETGVPNVTFVGKDFKYQLVQEDHRLFADPKPKSISAYQRICLKGTDIYSIKYFREGSTGSTSKDSSYFFYEEHDSSSDSNNQQFLARAVCYFMASDTAFCLAETCKCDGSDTLKRYSFSSAYFQVDTSTYERKLIKIEQITKRAMVLSSTSVPLVTEANKPFALAIAMLQDCD